MTNKLLTLADMLPVTSHADRETMYNYGESNPLSVIHRGELLHVTNIVISYYGISITFLNVSRFGYHSIIGIDPKQYIIYDGSEAQQVLYLNNENT